MNYLKLFLTYHYYIYVQAKGHVLMMYQHSHPYRHKHIHRLHQRNQRMLNNHVNLLHIRLPLKEIIKLNI